VIWFNFPIGVIFIVYGIATRNPGCVVLGLCFIAVGIVLAIVWFTQRGKAESDVAAQRAKTVALERARTMLASGCPKCQGDLGIGQDTPIEKVQQVMAGRCFYCGADLRSAVQGREN